MEGKNCEISIEKRPGYCDRGRFIAKLHMKDPRVLFIDTSDGWPRYYFVWSNCVTEIEEWLKMRNELAE